MIVDPGLGIFLAACTLRVRNIQLRAIVPHSREESKSDDGDQVEWGSLYNHRTRVLPVWFGHPTFGYVGAQSYRSADD